MQEIGILFAALLLDYMLGDPRTKYHPVCLMGNFAYALEGRLRRGDTGFVLFLRGALAWFCTVAVATFTAWFLVFLGSVGSSWLGSALCAFIIAVCMAPKSLAEHAQRICLPLEREDITSARQNLAMIVGRDVQNLDAHGIARAGIESVGENLVDGVLSSLFWATVGLVFWGCAGAAALVTLHRVSNVLDAQWGKKNEKYRYFGTCAARVDDALNFIPARLSLPCICFAALLMQMVQQRTVHLTGKAQLFKVAFAYRYAHASPNSAWSEAAFASALGLTLGGPVSYGGMPAQYPHIGQGSSKATAMHMRQAITLLWVSTLLWLLSSALLLALV